jgi:hypothetical protein
MAFSNLWDQTFPPDTQLASLGGADLRQLRVDTQQRMAAISGLDAAKPAFGADAQPAQWNGILFFATDTGNIYQFNNPSWTNVTSSFLFRNNALKAINQTTHTGTTTLDTIYSLTVPGNAIGATGRVRMTLVFYLNVIGGSNTLEITFGGTNLLGSLNISPSLGIGTQLKFVLEGGNIGTTNSQRWDGMLFVSPDKVRNLGNQVTSAIDTTSSVAVNVLWQNSANSDSQIFDFFTLEIF